MEPNLVKFLNEATMKGASFFNGDYYFKIICDLWKDVKIQLVKISSMKIAIEIEHKLV